MKTRSHERVRGEKVLVVEDDRSLRRGLMMNLTMRGYDAVCASDGEEGMRMAFDEKPDLIVMDITMPGWSGLEIVEELRKRGERVPVLILSARSQTHEKVAGLNLGADDYMTKPFDLPELIARIEVMLRRSRKEAVVEPVLSANDIEVNKLERSVTLRGKSVSLNAKEFDILVLFMEAPGHVFTRELILERVWGWDYEGTARTVDNYITSLRRKLERGSNTPKHIETVPRVGYRFATI